MRTLLLLLLSATCAVAQLRISEFPPISTVEATNLFIMTTQPLQAGGTKRITVSDFLTAATDKQFINFKQTNTLYVRVDGNDSTAQRGRTDKPWATITNAFKYATNGDCIDIGPGRFTQVNAPTLSDLIVRSPLFFYNKSNITIRGAGMWATELYSTNIGDQLVISNCNNITIQDIGFNEIKHAGAAVTALVAQIHLAWSNDAVNIERCRFENANDQGISSCFFLRNSHVSVRGNYFRNIGTQAAQYNGLADGACYSGIGVGTDVSHNIMDGCIYGVEIDGIVDPSALTNRNIRVIGNLIRATHYGVNGGSFGAVNAYENITIVGNTIEPPQGTELLQSSYGGNGIICFGNARNWTISGNVIMNMFDGINIVGASATTLQNILVCNNVVKREDKFSIFTAQNGITLENFSGRMDNITVAQNMVDGYWRAGYVFSAVSNFVCIGNTAVNCGHSDEAWVGAFQFDNLKRDGILQAGSARGGFVSGNRVIASGGTNTIRGFIFGNGATNIVVSDNFVSGTVSTGIVVQANALNIELRNNRFTPDVTKPIYNLAAASFISDPVAYTNHIAMSGTNVVVPMNQGDNQYVALTGNPLFITTNRNFNPAAREITVEVAAGGSARTLFFSSGWTWTGTNPPTGLDANKKAVLTLRLTGTNESGVLASWQ